MLFSKDYKRYSLSRHSYRQDLVISLRIGVSVLLLVQICLKSTLGNFQKTQFSVGLSLLASNIIFSNLVLREQFKALNSFYLFGIQIGLICLDLDEAFSENWNQNLLFGLKLGLLHCLLFFSKLPLWQTVLGFISLLGHLLIRSFTVDFSYKIEAMTTTIIVYIMLLYIFLRKDTFEYKIWLDLDKSHAQLKCFHQLIQIFPSKILIFDKESWKKGEVLYMNETVRSHPYFIKHPEYPLHFLKEFVLDEFSNDIHLNNNDEEIHKFPCYDHFKANLFDYIHDIIDRGLENIIDFESHLATHQEITSQNFILPSVSVKETDSISKRRFEVKLGTIPWGDRGSVIVILNDISKSEKIRELSILHRNKDRLLATISHELRTPLNGLLGMLQVARDRISDPKIMKYLQIACNSARTLLFMINDILDVSQAQNRCLKLNMKPFNLSNSIEELLPIFKLQAKKKGLIFQYENICPRSLLTMADSVRLQQVLFNLLTNASKFTERGKISLKATPVMENRGGDEKGVSISEKGIQDIHMEAISGNNQVFTDSFNSFDSIPAEYCTSYEKIKIMVEDTGIGISPDLLPNIFKLFAKIDDKSNETGVGLGLAISQILASKFFPGGLHVESEVGKGSKFWFFLKVSRNESLRQAIEGSSIFHPMPVTRSNNVKASPNTQKPPSLESNFKIMVVEDDQINHIVIQKYLKEIETSLIDKAFNGREALEKIKERARAGIFFDLILMDCNMPVMDGFEATENIRRMETDGIVPKLVILAVTANVTAADKVHCLKIGMNGVITKPIEKPEFLNIIQSFKPK